MKRVLWLLAGSTFLLLTGCEVTKEITLKENGSGTLVNTTDMSGLIGMAKMSAKGEELDKLGDEGSMDTTILLASVVDSIPDLSAADRDLIKGGKLGLVIDVKNDKFITKLEFPFTNLAQAAKLDQLSSGIIQQVLKKKAGEKESMPPGMEGAGLPESSIDDYYTLTYAKGVIEKKLNKDKYADLDNDEGMKGLKQMAGMGMGNTTVIINLPFPAKKAEGKTLTLSDDKRKVTITSNAEDFFATATDLEYRIEY